MMDKKQAVHRRGRADTAATKLQQIKQTTADGGACEACRYGQNAGLSRGVGVSKEQNNLGISTTLKRCLHGLAGILYSLLQLERADKSARVFFSHPSFLHSAEAATGPEVKQV